MKLKNLVAELQGVQTWREPKVELEQYPTPPDVAAHMLFAADAQGDLKDALVADLGCGGAILGIGATRARSRPRLMLRHPACGAARDDGSRERSLDTCTRDAGARMRIPSRAIGRALYTCCDSRVQLTICANNARAVFHVRHLSAIHAAPCVGGQLVLASIQSATSQTKRE